MIVLWKGRRDMEEGSSQLSAAKEESPIVRLMTDLKMLMLANMAVLRTFHKLGMVVSKASR